MGETIQTRRVSWGESRAAGWVASSGRRAVSQRKGNDEIQRQQARSLWSIGQRLLDPEYIPKIEDTQPGHPGAVMLAKLLR